MSEKAKVVLKTLFSALVFVLAFELILKAAGLFVSLEQNRANARRLHLEPSSELRILCIGESTTAAYFAGKDDFSWPRILERKLNEREEELGFKSVVFNEAYPSTNTTVLSLKLPGYIEKYHPHIVVSMMGINDGPWGTKIAVRRNFFMKLFMKTQTFKVINYFFPLEDPRFQLDIKGEVPALSAPFGRFQDYLKENSHVDVDSLLKLYDEIKPDLKSPRERGEYHAMVADELARHSSNGDSGSDTEIIRMNECYEYLKKVYREDEIVDFTFDSFLVCGRFKRDSIRESVALALAHYDKGYKFNEQTMAHMLSLEHAFSESEYSAVLARLDLEKEGRSRLLWGTQQNYQNVASLLNKNGILYFSMIYPSGNANAIRRIFSDEKLPVASITSIMYSDKKPDTIPDEFSSVIPVGNENFLQKCKVEVGECYKDIWTTSFGGKFGHMTEFGHEMVADNLMKVMLENKDKIRSQLN